jgi:hypothetical protein
MAAAAIRLPSCDCYFCSSLFLRRYDVCVHTVFLSFSGGGGGGGGGGFLSFYCFSWGGSFLCCICFCSVPFLWDVCLHGVRFVFIF